MTSESLTSKSHEVAAVRSQPHSGFPTPEMLQVNSNPDASVVAVLLAPSSTLLELPVEQSVSVFHVLAVAVRDVVSRLVVEQVYELFPSARYRSYWHGKSTLMLSSVARVDPLRKNSKV